MSVLYLLYEGLSEYGIPDTFLFVCENFFYNKMHSLTINDYDLLRGKYMLVIFPIDRRNR